MQVQETVTRPQIAPRLGPAPARMGAAVTVPISPAQDKAAPPRAFPWVAKRFAIWSLGTILSATAFHLTGFVLLGVIAIVFPIVYWARVVFDGQRVWGAATMPRRGFDVLQRMQRESLNRYIPGTPEYRMYHID
jgi:hypothetical protein